MKILTNLELMNGGSLSLFNIDNTASNTVTLLKLTNWDGASAHAVTPHAPSNAQRNSDITTTEIQDKLTGVITTHTHDAAGISTGTLVTGRGGTGMSTYTTGSYIRASGTATLEQRTAAQVLGDIGAAPAAHAHGSLTSAGHIGAVANLPIITGAAGVLQTGAFGIAANTFCQGNDARLTDARVPIAHNQDMGTITTGLLLTNRLLEPESVTASITGTARPLFDVLRADRVAFLPASQIIIESSTDNGNTWVDAGVSDINKRRLFTGQRPSVPIPVIGGIKNTNCLLRITITAMRYNVPPATPETQRYNFWNSANVLSTERYCTFNEGWIWLTAGADRIHCRVERANGDNSNNWVLDREAFMAGWSGGNYLRLSGNVFGGGTTQIAQPWNWRFTMRTATGANNFDNGALNTTWAAGSQSIHQIKLTGINTWAHSNHLSFHDRIYSFDENQNTVFPSAVTATQLFEGANRVYSANNNNIGGGATQYVAGNDIRLTDARTPVAHAHGGISNIGAIGTVATLPIITGASGVLQAGSFGTGAGTFCQGNDARLADARAPIAHNHFHIQQTDSRNDNHAPFFYQGISHHLKLNTATGLSDGGSFHGLMQITPWTDISGGSPHQLGFTSNGNIFHRNHDGAAWSAWTRIEKTNHGNHVPAIQTANNAVFLRNDNVWQTVTPDNIGAAPSASPVFTGTVSGITAAMVSALPATHDASGVTAVRLTNWDTAHTHAGTNHTTAALANVSLAEAQAGTLTTMRGWTPQNVRQAIDTYYISSEAEPTANLRDGLMWYRPSTFETRVYFNLAFRTIGSAGAAVSLRHFTSTTTLASLTNTASINIAQYNRLTDVLLVYINSTFAQVGADYDVPNNTTITRPSGNWNAGTIINFVVIRLQ